MVPNPQWMQLHMLSAMARKNNAQLIVLHVLFSPLGYEYSSGKFGDETIPSSVKQIFGAARMKQNSGSIKLKKELIMK